MVYALAVQFALLGRPFFGPFSALVFRSTNSGIWFDRPTPADAGPGPRLACRTGGFEQVELARVARKSHNGANRRIRSQISTGPEKARKTGNPIEQIERREVKKWIGPSTSEIRLPRARCLAGPTTTSGDLRQPLLTRILNRYSPRAVPTAACPGAPPREIIESLSTNAILGLRLGFRLR